MGKRILLLSAIFGCISSAHAVIFLSLTPDFETGQLARFATPKFDRKLRPIQPETVRNLVPHGYRPEDFVLETSGIFISDEF